MIKLRIAGTVNDSIVDGEGLRYTIFVQGCPHHCKGCHNPQTHSFSGGEDVELEYLMQQIQNNPLLDGVTFSGGEPFEQSEALTELASKIKNRCPNMNIVTYTGYTFEYLLDRGLKDRPEWLDLLRKTDILIDGEFIESLKSLELKYRGSSNQRILDCKESLKERKAVLVKEL